MEPDEGRYGNLLDVGLTLTIDHLVVTWAGRSEFTNRVLWLNQAALWVDAAP